LIQQHLSGGGKLVTEIINQQLEVARAISTAMYLKPLDLNFDDKMNYAMEVMEKHFARERESIFPRLQAAVPPKVLDQLNYKILKNKTRAPTRPHPMMPKTGFLGKVADRLAAAMDTVADALTTRVTPQ